MISFVAMDRIVEKQAASDAKYREELGERPLRSHARRFTDGELLAKLRSFGIDLDRASLERLCERALSAEEIARSLLAGRNFKNRWERLESDWVWISLSALWRRWFPGIPSFERLDDKMQTGYEVRASGGAAAACRIWLDAWTDVVLVLDKAHIESIREFDDRFGGTQSLFNWIQDLEGELWNAGLEDRQFLSARIEVGNEWLRRFAAGHDLITENWRRALAESYYELGEGGKTEALYREWLKTDPQWGWGWIGWSDCYRHTRTESRGLQRSEQLLREGLSIAEVRDRADLAERLADLCEEQGRAEEAEEFRKQGRSAATGMRQAIGVHSSGSVLRQKTTIEFEDGGLPLTELPNLRDVLRSVPAAAKQKAGRNDPCPCGSGKKFKKCCVRGQ